MIDSSATKPSLLIRLRDERDAAAWSQFVEIYGPLMYEFLRKRSLQDSDAADLTQEVLASVASAIKTFDCSPDRGSFRGWLLRIVKNELNGFWRTRDRRAVGTGDTQMGEFLREQPEPHNGDASAWDEEYQKRMFQFAAERVRDNFQPSTWQAFWETTVEGQSINQVAKRLGLTNSAIYKARQRVIGQIKQQVKHVEGDLP
jgi:RNA polymerase sigma factor (sigma-70 family)